MSRLAKIVCIILFVAPILFQAFTAITVSFVWLFTWPLNLEPGTTAANISLVVGALVALSASAYGTFWCVRRIWPPPELPAKPVEGAPPTP